MKVGDIVYVVHGVTDPSPERFIIEKVGINYVTIDGKWFDRETRQRHPLYYFPRFRTQEEQDHAVRAKEARNYLQALGITVRNDSIAIRVADCLKKEFDSSTAIP